MTREECFEWFQRWAGMDPTVGEVHSEDAQWEALNLDSLDFVELAMDIEVEFGGELNDAAVKRIDSLGTLSVRDVVDILYRHVNRQD